MLMWSDHRALSRHQGWGPGDKSSTAADVFVFAGRPDLFRLQV